jgi:hypothetical protein
MPPRPCEAEYVKYMEKYIQRKVDAAEDADHAASARLLLDSFRCAKDRRVTVITDGEDDAVSDDGGTPSALALIGDPRERYSDECIYLVLEATLAEATETLRGCTLFVDSVLTEGLKIKPREQKPTTVVCPVHRVKDEHWVFYGIRRQASGISVYFSNSLAGSHSATELARLDTLIRRFDETFPSIVDEDVVRLDCPTQTDSVSCGVYVAETIRRFIIGDDDCWAPPEVIRSSHLTLVKDLFRT